MRTYIILAIFSVCSLLADPLQDHKIEEKALIELAAKFGITPDQDIIAETQKQWIRKLGSERWEMSEINAELRAFVIDWSKKNGVFTEWRPSSSDYDKGLILGATTGRMASRLNYLKQLWIEGVRFKEIVWLTGDRPLDGRIDGMLDRCQNESDAARALWCETDLPPEMKCLPVAFVAVPMKADGKRPNTEDTIVAWLQNTSACKALFVSDQPFCGYQSAVIASCLPKEFSFDVVGEGVTSVEHPAAAAIILDAIARWIYQDQLNHE